MIHIIKKIHSVQLMLLIIVGLVVVTPIFSFAQNPGLVPCTNSGAITVVNGVSTVGAVPDDQKCDFKALLTLINNVVHFILFYMVVPIAAIMFCYAGFLLVTSGGESSKKTKAKNIFSNVVWGVIIAIAAWLIVSTILKLLGFDGSLVGF